AVRLLPREDDLAHRNGGGHQIVNEGGGQNQRGARAAEENRHQRVPPVCRVWAAMPATSHRKPGNRPMPTVADDKVAMAQNMAVGTGRAMRPPARDFQNPLAHTLPMEMMVSMPASSAATGSQIMPC